MLVPCIVANIQIYTSFWIEYKFVNFTLVISIQKTLKKFKNNWHSIWH